MGNFFKTLLPNFARSFSGRVLIWHLVAIASTYILVVSGFDWQYFLAVRNPVLNSIFFPALILGGLVPIFLPLILLWISKKRSDERLSVVAWAMGQAAFLGWLISSLYKSLTGRVQPNFEDLATDISHQFQFGFLHHGIFWGWPSSHTTVAFAVAITLVIIFSKNWKIKYGSLAAALYVGIGVSLGIHWFSEFIAGAIIGSVIGVVVGKSFKERLDKKDTENKL